MALKQIFLKCFRSTCFCSSPRFHISGFAAFQICLLICYFYFSDKIGKVCFSLNHCFRFVIYPRRLSFVKNFIFMGNEVCDDIKNSFIKNRYLLITFLSEKVLSQLHWNMDCWIRSLFTSWYCQTTLSYGGGIMFSS